MPLTRKSVLYGAEQCIMHTRDQQYGDLHSNFRTIANLWEDYLTAKYPSYLGCINEMDVSVMMALLKVARIASNPKHEDNYIDGCGYLACAAEIATNMDEKG